MSSRNLLQQQVQESESQLEFHEEQQEIKRKKVPTQAKQKQEESPRVTEDEKLRNQATSNLLCLAGQRIKFIWDVITSLNLVAACFAVPLNLAFYWLDDYKQVGSNMFVFDNFWSSLDSIIDIIFMLEILVCFNTCYYDNKNNEYVTSRCQIAKHYTTGWFWIDLAAILPRLTRSIDSVILADGLKVLGFIKVARFGRLIRFFHLLKLAKTIQKTKKLKKHMQTKMRLNVAIERLFLFAIFSLLFIHTISCLWIFLGALNMGDKSIDNWIDTFEFNLYSIGSMYTIGLYWTVTTITTVGYGDISATNTAERIVASIIMIIGVIAFSFSTGSLSSIIQNVDSRAAAYRKRLEVLKELKKDFKIDDQLYLELKAFINFQSYQRDQERDTFINELPDRLKNRISEVLFEEYRKKIHFFKQVDSNQEFITWVCPKLKPLEVIKGSLIQQESEKLTSISFIKEGEAEYISARCNNKVYLRCQVGDHFGLMDIVFRLRAHQKAKNKKRQRRRLHKLRKHKRQMKQKKHSNSSKQSSPPSSSSSSLSSYSSLSSSSDEEDFATISQKIRCKFTIRAKETCFLLQMGKETLEKMEVEFPEVWLSLIVQEQRACYYAIVFQAKLIDHEKKQARIKDKREKRLTMGLSCQSGEVDSQQSSYDSNETFSNTSSEDYSDYQRESLLNAGQIDITSFGDSQKQNIKRLPSKSLSTKNDQNYYSQIKKKHTMRKRRQTQVHNRQDMNILLDETQAYQPVNFQELLKPIEEGEYEESSSFVTRSESSFDPTPKRHEESDEKFRLPELNTTIPNATATMVTTLAQTVLKEKINKSKSAQPVRSKTGKFNLKDDELKQAGQDNRSSLWSRRNSQDMVEPDIKICNMGTEKTSSKYQSKNGIGSYLNKGDQGSVDINSQREGQKNEFVSQKSKLTVDINIKRKNSHQSLTVDDKSNPSIRSFSNLSKRPSDNSINSNSKDSRNSRNTQNSKMRRRSVTMKRIHETAQDRKKSIKTNRRFKLLDEEEQMVLHGYKSTIYDKSKARQHAKNLTKTNKKEHHHGHKRDSRGPIRNLTMDPSPTKSVHGLKTEKAQRSKVARQLNSLESKKLNKTGVTISGSLSSGGIEQLVQMSQEFQNVMLEKMTSMQNDLDKMRVEQDRLIAKQHEVHSNQSQLALFELNDKARDARGDLHILETPPWHGTRSKSQQQENEENIFEKSLADDSMRAAEAEDDSAVEAEMRQVQLSNAQEEEKGQVEDVEAFPITQ